MAARYGHLEVVRFLVESGANEDQGTADNGRTPLHIAAQNGHFELVISCPISRWGPMTTSRLQAGMKRVLENMTFIIQYWMLQDLGHCCSFRPDMK